MKKKQYLFIYLLFSLLLVELNLYGMVQTGNTYYLLSLFLSTSAMIYISYHIYRLTNPGNKATKNYYFYFINNDITAEENIWLRQISERM